MKRARSFLFLPIQLMLDAIKDCHSFFAGKRFRWRRTRTVTYLKFFLRHGRQPTTDEITACFDCPDDHPELIDYIAARVARPVLLRKEKKISGEIQTTAVAELSPKKPKTPKLKDAGWSLELFIILLIGALIILWRIFF